MNILNKFKEQVANLDSDKIKAAGKSGLQHCRENPADVVLALAAIMVLDVDDSIDDLTEVLENQA